MVHKLTKKTAWIACQTSVQLHDEMASINKKMKKWLAAHVQQNKISLSTKIKYHFQKRNNPITAVICSRVINNKQTDTRILRFKNTNCRPYPLDQSCRVSRDRDDLTKCRH